MLCKKAGISERKWKSHSSNICFGKRSYQQSIKDRLGGPIGNIVDAAKHSRKTEKKWERDLEFLRKQRNMLFSMKKKYGLINEIKKINAKSFKERS